MIQGREKEKGKADKIEKQGITARACLRSALQK
jgi:hypothetical protein